MLWQWKTLFSIGFPFPNLEYLFEIDFWEGLKSLNTMSFVLGILATIIDVFSDFGLPVLFSMASIVFPDPIAMSKENQALAKEQMGKLNAAKKSFLKKKPNLKVLVQYAQSLKDRAAQDMKEKRHQGPVAFGDVNDELYEHETEHEAG